MSKQITNEQAERGLLVFFWEDDNDPKYANFSSFYGGVVSMVAHKYFGWTSGITEAGYEQVMSAYQELDSLGYFEMYNEEDIDNVIRVFGNDR